MIIEEILEKLVGVRKIFVDVEILERFCGYIEEVSVRVDHKLSKDFLFLILQSLHLSYSSFNA